MGNICRSPAAEGFFRHHLARSALSGAINTDSAGTHSYHVGCAPDERAIRVSADFGVDITSLRARQIRPADFEAFDLIIPMDQQNLDSIRRLQPAGARAQVHLMMAFDPEAGWEEVPDPYYGQDADFRLMCTLLDGATAKLLRHLEQEAAA